MIDARKIALDEAGKPVRGLGRHLQELEYGVNCVEEGARAALEPEPGCSACQFERGKEIVCPDCQRKRLAALKEASRERPK